MVILNYIGDGAYLTGVPARDLTQQDIDESGHSQTDLVETGLYQLAIGVVDVAVEDAPRPKRSKQHGE